MEQPITHDPNLAPAGGQEPAVLIPEHASADAVQQGADGAALRVAPELATGVVENGHNGHGGNGTIQAEAAPAVVENPYKVSVYGGQAERRKKVLDQIQNPVRGLEYTTPTPAGREFPHAKGGLVNTRKETWGTLHDDVPSYLEPVVVATPEGDRVQYVAPDGSRLSHEEATARPVGPEVREEISDPDRSAIQQVASAETAADLPDVLDSTDRAAATRGFKNSNLEADTNLKKLKTAAAELLAADDATRTQNAKAVAEAQKQAEEFRAKEKAAHAAKADQHRDRREHLLEEKMNAAVAPEYDAARQAVIDRESPAVAAEVDRRMDAEYGHLKPSAHDMVRAGLLKQGLAGVEASADQAGQKAADARRAHIEANGGAAAITHMDMTADADAKRRAYQERLGVVTKEDRAAAADGSVQRNGYTVTRGADMPSTGEFRSGSDAVVPTQSEAVIVPPVEATSSDSRPAVVEPDFSFEMPEVVEDIRNGVGQAPVVDADADAATLQPDAQGGTAATGANSDIVDDGSWSPFHDGERYDVKTDGAGVRIPHSPEVKLWIADEDAPVGNTDGQNTDPVEVKEEPAPFAGLDWEREDQEAAEINANLNAAREKSLKARAQRLWYGSGARITEFFNDPNHPERSRNRRLIFAAVAVGVLSVSLALGGGDESTSAAHNSGLTETVGATGSSGSPKSDVLQQVTELVEKKQEAAEQNGVGLYDVVGDKVTLQQSGDSIWDSAKDGLFPNVDDSNLSQDQLARISEETNRIMNEAGIDEEKAKELAKGTVLKWPK